MKQGRTLTELAAEITRQAEVKKDYIVDTSVAAMAVVANVADATPRVTMNFGDLGLDVNDYAHGQLATHAGIPAAYYNTMRSEAPGLLATNVNHWLHAKPEKRMFRTLDNKLRGVLSSKFRSLDNYDLAEAALPVLMKLDLEILSCELTERRLYLKAVDKRITKDVPTGRKMGDGSHVFFDTVSPALIISNSEVGAGALSIETAVWTKVCTNLAAFSQRSMKKYHVGSRADIGEQVYALLSDQTRRITDAAIWMQVRDVIAGAFDEARFDASLDEMRGMAAQPISGDAVKVVEVTARKFGINEGERNGVLKHLIEGGDLSKYGLFNAITRTAEDLTDYDRATDFERMGGRLIELPRNEWEVLAKAA